MTRQEMLTIPREMRAARAQSKGAAVRVETLATPTAGPGQVLIRVESAAVNFSDVKRRRGDPYPFETVFPFVPGGEIAGTVVAHGAGVSSPPVGTAVFALAGPNGFGGYAQFAVSYAQTVVPIPPGLPVDTASVLTVAGATAKLLLTASARLQPGESILVPAATGGVGSFAIQIARQLQAGRIIAAVGSPAKREMALSLGAHDSVDYSEADWPSRVRSLTDDRGVDVALEASGGSMLEQTLTCLAPFGRLVVFGAASGRSARLSPEALERLLYVPAANQTISGFNVGAWFLERPDVAGHALTTLMRDVMSGTIRAPALRALPLEDVQHAHEQLEQRKVMGKLVVKPWS